MKQLITKSDGTPTKSKVHALQFLEKNGIPKEALIAENGQFFYETETTQEAFAERVPKTILTEEKPAEIFKHTKPLTEEITVKAVDVKPVSWETEVFDKNNERTKLFIPGTDVVATIIGKHPAGQNRSKSAFELNIENENFIMSVDLLSRIFKVRG